MLFTISIPAFKTSFLRQCIDSVLAQTYTDFEVVILNDDSPEDVKGIVDSYGDSRIRYYENDRNVGALHVVDNWNKCLQLAKGEFIICMGDDDMLMPCCLEQYARMIGHYPEVDLFHARTFRIDDNGAKIAVSQGYAEHEGVFSLMTHRLNFGIQFIGDFCYRTQSLRDIGGYYWLPMAWGTDDITAYLAASRHGVVNLPEPLFCYRTNQQSITSSGNIAVKMEAIEQQMSWLQDFLKTKQPSDCVEKLLRDELRQRYASHFIKQKAHLLENDMRHSKLNIFRWWHRRKRYHLNFATFVMALYYYHKQSPKA